MEEGHTTQWPKGKGQKDLKPQSTTQKNKIEQYESY
jgi:hypothetical protein